MAKAKNFSELRNRLPAESLARVEARVKVTLHDMALDELRTARELTQERLAETLGIKQATVSKIERQSVRIKQFFDARSPSVSAPQASPATGSAEN